MVRQFLVGQMKYIIKNTASIKIGKDACAIARVPAGEIEAVVVGQVRRILQAPEVMAQAKEKMIVMQWMILLKSMFSIPCDIMSSSPQMVRSSNPFLIFMM